MRKVVILFVLLFLVVGFSVYAQESELRKSYYDNGTLESEITYKDGKMNGPAKYYDQSGMVYLVKHYDKDGLMAEFSYKDGKKNGISRHYDKSGIIYLESHYKDDSYHGLLTHFYSTGKPNLEIEFKNNKKHGYFRKYNQSGVLIKERFYKEGVIQLSAEEIPNPTERELEIFKYFMAQTMKDISGKRDDVGHNAVTDTVEKFFVTEQDIIKINEDFYLVREIMPGLKVEKSDLKTIFEGLEKYRSEMISKQAK